MRSADNSAPAVIGEPFSETEPPSVSRFDEILEYFFSFFLSNFVNRNRFPPVFNVFIFIPTPAGEK